MEQEGGQRVLGAVETLPGEERREKRPLKASWAL